MKFFYSRGACSLAVRIALEELGIAFDAQQVDTRSAPSPEFLQLNPMGSVPVIVLEDGQVLTEVSVILQYLADLKPEAGLAPKNGTMDRVRLQQALNFIATELHRGFGPLWSLEAMTRNPEAREEIRQFTLNDLFYKFDILNQRLSKQEYMMLTGYSVADPYLFTMLSWAGFKKIDLSRWPALVSYVERMKARSAVKKALKDEHLLPASA